MKIVFISDYVSIHQKALCDAFYRLLSDDFLFIATTKIREARLNMGWHDFTDEVAYAVHHEKYSRDELYSLISQFDIVIIGSSHAKGINYALKNKLVFHYEERPLKNGLLELKNPKRIITILNTILTQRKKHHLLAASSFCYKDYKKLHCYKNRAWKWGYFIEPITRTYIHRNNKVTKVLWVGRLIEWKHCEMFINAANYINRNGLRAVFTIIGSGPCQNVLENQVSDNNKDGYVVFTGALSNDEARKYMKCSDIFVCTSDEKEGWGVVINEAMSAGCCTIASANMGGAEYLIRDRYNGFLFYKQSQIQLNHLLDDLIQHPDIIENVGIEACKTLNEIWSPDNAVFQFVNLSKQLLEGKRKSLVSTQEGPCSSA